MTTGHGRENLEFCEGGDIKVFPKVDVVVSGIVIETEETIIGSDYVQIEIWSWIWMIPVVSKDRTKWEIKWDSKPTIE